MLRAHHTSMVQKYKSCWRKFQDHLRCHLVDTIFTGTVMDFLTRPADSTNNALATILVHYVALADPLRFDFDKQVPDRALSLLLKGISTSRELRQ